MLVSGLQNAIADANLFFCVDGKFLKIFFNHVIPIFPYMKYLLTFLINFLNLSYCTCIDSFFDGTSLSSGSSLLSSNYFALFVPWSY